MICLKAQDSSVETFQLKEKKESIHWILEIFKKLSINMCAFKIVLLYSLTCVNNMNKIVYIYYIIKWISRYLFKADESNCLCWNEEAGQ